MSKTKRTVILLSVILLIAALLFALSMKDTQLSENDASSSTDNTLTQKENKDTHKSDPIRERIDSMTLQERVGQLVIVGFDGYTADDSIKTMIQSYKVGGVILFGRNVENAEQLITLNNTLKNINSGNKIPLFISIDEEGGKVSRMPKEIRKLPTNKTIGEANDENLSYEIGSILADEVKMFGFNMNFAPVLDINSNPQNPVIGDRSFGNSKEIVSRLGVQTMKGIQSGGVIPVVKHFPGHGDTSEDSHIGLPAVSHDMNRLIDFELIPFKDAINNQADAVMIAHILLNKIDSENPSSLSKTVITELLRNQLKFNGVIITDDMTMRAIVENYNIGEAAIKSVKAGSDIILVCHGYDNEIAVIDALKNAVENRTISQETINESVYRILKLKDKYKLSDDKIDKIDTINSTDIQKINDKIDEILGAT